MTDYIKFIIVGAVPKDTYDALPAATKTGIRDKFLRLKALCVKINSGQPTEENTVRFKYHICHHSAGGVQCDPEQDI